MEALNKKALSIAVKFLSTPPRTQPAAAITIDEIGDMIKPK